MSHSQASLNSATRAFFRQPLGVWKPALLLAIVIFCLMVGNNWHYLFATKLYEYTDFASDSLFIREAKHHLLLHGHYSRWLFYHPGPVLFDVMMLGEVLFYDVLHVVPTPLNGQLITLCFTMALFFSLTLSMFAQQLGSRGGGYHFFTPLALIFGLWHYGAVQEGGIIHSFWPGQVLMSPWPVHPPILAMLCFLVAAASVGSGRGQDLPVLVLAGGWLVHNYIAQPIFVVPLTLAAYSGLWVDSRRRERTQTTGASRALSAGWRTSPRAHIIALILLTLYVAPLAIDALRGSSSNLASILRYTRLNHEKSKSFSASLCYFLIFGSYDLYQAGRQDFGHYSAADILAFVRLHWRAYALWTTALLGAPVLFFAARHNRSVKEEVAEAPQSSRYFIFWFYAVVIVALVITLIWGMKQTGPMLYFNGYFNYSIYFCVTLGFASALAAALMTWTQKGVTRKLRLLFSGLLWLGVAGAAVAERTVFRSNEILAQATLQTMATNLERATAALPPDTVYFLDFYPWEAWTIAIGAALEIERLGHPFYVGDNLEIIYGARHTSHEMKLDPSTNLVRWVVKPSNQTPASTNQQPLLPGYVLEEKPLPDLDPNGQQIRFSQDGNFQSFACFGWAAAGDWTWSDQRRALLMFRPKELPKEADGVDMVVWAWSFAAPGRSGAQHAIIQFNGHPLSTVTLPLLGPQEQPVRIHIKREMWQEVVAKKSAWVQFDFPDAISPASLGGGSDVRLLGGGFSRIGFEITPALAPGW